MVAVATGCGVEHSPVPEQVTEVREHGSDRLSLSFPGTDDREMRLLLVRAQPQLMPAFFFEGSSIALSMSAAR